MRTGIMTRRSRKTQERRPGPAPSRAILLRSWIVTAAVAAACFGALSPVPAVHAQGQDPLFPSEPDFPALAEEVAQAGTPAAPAANQDDRDAILLNFESADIREVIYTFAAALDLNYWLDPRVQGQVTARSFGPIYIDDLFPVFMQILRSNGFSAIRQGDLYMVVPAEDGKTRASIRKGGAGENDEFVIELIKVTHVSSERIVEMLDPFVSPGGDVVAYPRNNLVVISDLASNATRLRELVRTFDNDAFRDLRGKVYEVEFASIDDISQELLSILEAYHVVDSGSRVQLIPLVRLNALAVIAFDDAVFGAVEYWLSVLDAPGAGGTERRVFVYKVENSKALDIAEVLNELYEGLGEDLEDAAGASGALAGRGLGLGGGLAGQQARRGRQTGRAAANEGARAAVRETAAFAEGEGGLSGALFEQEIRIVADELTNSLVILATPRDYQMIRSVLEELDLVPRQVLVEMMIAEIMLDDNESVGINHTIGNGSSSNDDGDSGNNDSGNIAVPGAAMASSLFSSGSAFRVDGSFGGSGADVTFSFFGGDYTTTLTALAQKNKVKVLSRPHILTADNQEARILVGAEIPIVTSQSDSGSQTDGDSVFRQNVEYRDTGVVVNVTPQVNSAGLVNMIISQEVSNIAGSTLQIEGIVSPSFTTRETETTVVVDSGETIVIGGIIAETKTQDRSGVPFLMDIPFLGQLFRARSSSLTRTELIILITPYVVRDRQEARSVTEEFKARIDEVLRELEIDEDPDGTHTVVLETPTM
jgi:general secretion pathway protein D